MKTIFKLFATAAIASFAFVSCDKENLTKTENGAAKDGVRTITVSFSPSTKSALSNDGLSPYFTNNDEIMLADKSGGTEKVKVTVNSNTATISTSLIGELTAVYPASASTDGVNFTVSSIQDGSFAKANICTATIPEGSSDASFENQTAILKFDLNHTGATELSVTGTNITNDANTGEITISSIPADGICYVSVLPASSVNLKFKHGEVSKNVNNASLAKNTLYTVKKDDWVYPYVEFTITLLEYNEEIDEYEPVDTKPLKVATVNVGADKVGDPGEYFAWAEVVGHKDKFDGQWDSFMADFTSFDHSDSRYNATEWDVTRWCFWKGNTPYIANDCNSYIKYNNKDTVTLESCDDAARVNWGGNWRMPTRLEMDALNRLTKTWDSNNGVIFSLEDESVLFPAAGVGDGSKLGSKGSKGYYWTSSCHPFYDTDAYSLKFNKENGCELVYVERCGGHSIRPVSD